ncbi:unnamed protein product [Amoebophrya sp. A25]|nr:unnamed protein product [Amoebophrya sp. A25]|eukprot:GSA25T00013535001.1
MVQQRSSLLSLLAATACLSTGTRAALSDGAGLGFGLEPVEHPPKKGAPDFLYVESAFEWAKFQRWALQKYPAAAPLECRDAAVAEENALFFVNLKESSSGGRRLVPENCKKLYREWQTNVHMVKTSHGGIQAFCELGVVETITNVLQGKPAGLAFGNHVEKVRVALPPRRTGQCEAPTLPGAVDAEPVTEEQVASPVSAADISAGVAQLRDDGETEARGAKLSPNAFSCAEDSERLKKETATNSKTQEAKGRKRGAKEAFMSILGRGCKRRKQEPVAKNQFQAHLFGPVEENKVVKNVFLLAKHKEGQEIIEFCLETAAKQSKILLDITAKWDNALRLKPYTRLYMRSASTSPEVTALTDWVYRIPISPFSTTVKVSRKPITTELADPEQVAEEQWLEAYRGEFVEKMVDLSRSVHKEDGSAWQKVKCGMNSPVWRQWLTKVSSGKKTKREILRWTLYIGMAVGAMALRAGIAAALAPLLQSPVDMIFGVIPNVVTVPYASAWVHRAGLPKFFIPSFVIKLLQFFPRATQKNIALGINQFLSSWGHLLIFAVFYDAPGRLAHRIWPDGALPSTVDGKNISDLAKKMAEWRSESQRLAPGDYVMVQRQPSFSNRIRGSLFWGRPYQYQAGDYGKVVSVPVQAPKADGSGRIKMLDQKPSSRTSILWSSKPIGIDENEGSLAPKRSKTSGEAAEKDDEASSTSKDARTTIMRTHRPQDLQIVMGESGGVVKLLPK